MKNLLLLLLVLLFTIACETPVESIGMVDTHKEIGFTVQKSDTCTVHNIWWWRVVSGNKPTNDTPLMFTPFEYTDTIYTVVPLGVLLKVHGPVGKKGVWKKEICIHFVADTVDVVVLGVR